MTELKITALAPWFGSNRMLAHEVGKLLKGCSWVGVPFAGSMTELIYIDAPTLVVSDLHRHVINLARVAADPMLNRDLRGMLRKAIFHPDELSRCQAVASRKWDFNSFTDDMKVKVAYAYFVCSWMGRSGNCGTDKELTGKLPVRWTATGGDSCTRFRSAVDSLKAWQGVLRRASFVVQDVFEFLNNMKDRPGHGLYCDPPFPDAGDAYSCKFTEAQHRELSTILTCFKHVRIVCRFYDHPLIRRLYHDHERYWTWHHFTGRKQSNASAPEVLLVRRNSGESNAC